MLHAHGPPCYNTPLLMQTSDPVFDCHVHLYPDPLAAKAVGELSRRFGNPPAFDGTVAGLTADFAKSGIRGALNLPVATRPEQVDSINAWAASVNTGSVRSLATVHPDTPDIPGTLAAIKAAGFSGIKLHPEYQAFPLDDPRATPIWETCPGLGLLVFLHAGGERVFPAPYRTWPASIARLLADHSDLTIIAAHLGGFQMWDEAERELIGKQIYLDLSHTFFWMSEEQILRMILNHGADRILFGTDAPWQTPSEVLQAFLKLPLTPEQQRAILWDNAARLFSL